MHGSGALKDVQKELSGPAHIEDASSAMFCSFGTGRGGFPFTPFSNGDTTAGGMNLQLASSPSTNAKVLESASRNASISDGSLDPKQKATLLRVADPRSVVFSMFKRCIPSSLSDACVDVREYRSAYLEAASTAARPADFFSLLLFSFFAVPFSLSWVLVVPFSFLSAFLASFSSRRLSLLSRC